MPSETTPISHETFMLLNYLYRRPGQRVSVNRNRRLVSLCPNIYSSDAYRDGLIHFDHDCCNNYLSLTPSGRSALLSAQNVKKQLADQRAHDDSRDHANARRSWWQFWLGVVVGFLLDCLLRLLFL